MKVVTFGRPARLSAAFAMLAVCAWLAACGSHARPDEPSALSVGSALSTQGFTANTQLLAASVGSGSTGLELKALTNGCGTNQVEQFFSVTNNGTTAVPLSSIQIKLWVDDTSGQTVVPQVFTGGCVSNAGNPSCVHQVSGVTAASASFSPACGPSATRQANWEITVSNTDGGTLPPGGTWSNVQAALHLANYSNFSPGTAAWYSGCLAGGAGAGYVDTLGFALYQNGSLVTSSTGVPPSCRATTGSQKLAGEVPPAVATAPLVGPLPGSTVLTLNIGLPLQSNGVPGSGFPPIDTYIKQISDPRSPPSLARKYLTPSGFAAAYGPSASDYASLTSFATSNGLTVARSYTARNLLTVTGPASTIEKAFFVTLDVYKRTDGSLFFAPANDPSANFSIPILHVSGFDSFSRAKAMGGTSPTSCTQSPVGTAREFFGTDFRNVYLPGCATAALEGQGQTVALLEFDTYVTADVLDYALGDTPAGTGAALDAPGLPTTLSNVTQELVPSSTQLGFGAFTFSPGGGFPEVDLDMQMVLAMAPQAGLIVYEYNGSVFDTILAQMADDDRAQTISSSWSWTSSTENLNIQSIFQQYAVQGQSFFIASGDSGAYVATDPYDTADPGNTPFFTEPTFDSPLMTVVGGTELTTSGTNGTLGSYASETTWNDIGPNEDGAGRPGNSVTTGGFCTGGAVPVLSIPDYQVNVNPANAEVNANPSNARMIPDVAFVADNLAMFCGVGLGGCGPAGQTEVCGGGTSAAAPLWAAFAALINQSAGSRGSIGYANPTLYFLASSAGSYALDFNDVADDSNNDFFDDGRAVEGTAPLNGVVGPAPAGASETPGLFHAVGGYDLATGLGTPRCSLISALPPQSCSVGSSVSALVTGKNVTAYMPVGSWNEPASGIKVIAVEGSGPNTTIATGTGAGTGVINTCAGNSVTGTVVCTANTPDANGDSVYVINGTAITASLASAGVAPGETFSGGNCQTCNVVVDPLHNQAFLSVGTASGTAALQTLDLATSPPTLGASPFPTGQSATSEDIVVDAVRGLVLSPNEQEDYLLVDTTSGQAFNFDPTGSAGEFDSAAEDCATGIALSTGEFGGGTLFLTDIGQATFTAGPGTTSTWSAPSQFLTFPEFSGFAAGLSGVAVDSSGSHLGVVAGEFGGNQFGLIQLPASSVKGSAPAIVDYVEAAVPTTPDGNPWGMGEDPHTLTVYASPTNGQPYAIFEDDAFGTGQRTFLAVVDLVALQKLPRVIGLGGTAPHVVASPLTTCTGSGPNPPGCIVRFVAVP